ncbi:crotonase/enoyl-CoA hydratase family protein [Burkholderia lata]|uniref:Enoyl-CoA hydratase / short chain enoyl-CoA hydratase n=1 Tax=Burkholderia lata (strain ATCC 17760 / DSM 23089 / LMG 22485 / NCIMB 9086 / R18194 / 383) TaxID=482957 RepID=Q39MZ4_BURL3|nr:crotonase/enoyl-CoA hydratase family protein [Burkholderia lata]ABB06172.1 Enoyl-CoA hydratase / short chain enoyl-CoA hydratase [Burkholderia lata]
MNPFLLYEQEGHVVTLTMNDPERRNPLTGNTAVAEFLAAIERIQGDRSVRAVIITGAGKAFSTGGNIRDMERQASGEVPGLQIREEYRQGIQRLPLALFNLEVPVIAAVNGPAMGAGLDLTCMCDLRIASEQARFAESFVKLGIIPGDGGAWLLPRVIGLARAAELTFTGDPIDAATALEWNLVSRVVPHEQLLPAANEIAARIAANPPHAVRLAKRLLREALHSRLDTLLELSSTYQALSHQTADHRESVAAFLEKRPPVFSGN